MVLQYGNLVIDVLNEPCIHVRNEPCMCDGDSCVCGEIICLYCLSKYLCGGLILWISVAFLSFMYGVTNDNARVLAPMVTMYVLAPFIDYYCNVAIGRAYERIVAIGRAYKCIVRYVAYIIIGVLLCGNTYCTIH
jgi:hypothetical protein